MLVIFLNWLFTTYIGFTIGVIARRWVGGGTGFVITMMLGLFVVSLITTALLFFVAADGFLLGGFFVVAVLCHVVCRREVGESLRVMGSLFKGRWLIIFTCVLLFCMLVLSAQASKINDDGLYYIQTTMWFSQVGFVKGISNLMLPLGLGSSWHVLQALFSLDFIDGMRFNDLNGLLILLLFVFCVENRFTEQRNGLLAILLAMVIVISVPFLSAPSPDLPVIVFTVMAFYLVTSRRIDGSMIADVLMVAAFGVMIKVSAVALVLLAVVVLLFAFVQRVGIPRRMFFVLAFAALLFLAKNVYQTGYPLYPYTWLGVHALDWTTPKDLLACYGAGIKSWGTEDRFLAGAIQEWSDPGVPETIQLLWDRGGYKGLMNKIIIAEFPLILLTLVADVRRRYKRKALPWFFGNVHFIFIVNFFVWLTLAPQYRFMLPAYIFFGSYAVWWWLGEAIEQRIGDRIKVIPYVAIAVLLIVSVVPLNLEVDSTSRYIGKTDGFSTERVIMPHVSYSFRGLDTLVVADHQYYHVAGNSYCWDSPLPCMSERYYEFVRDVGYEVVWEGSNFVMR